MNAELFPPIPADTAKAARSVFGKTNFYLSTGDQANRLFSGLVIDDPMDLAHLSSRTIAMLYLITIFQYGETMPDSLATDALRMRVDWKYALHLPLNYPGLKGLAFCEFRKSLLTDRTAKRNLQTLLERMAETRWTFERSAFTFSVDEIVRGVCTFSRLAQTWETMCRALEVLAAKQPDWLRRVNLPHWYERYGNHRRTINLAAAGAEQIALAQSIGEDGFHLLKAISQEEKFRANMPEVQALQDVWEAQFELVNEEATWREEACADCLCPIQRIASISSNYRAERKGGHH